MKLVIFLILILLRDQDPILPRIEGSDGERNSGSDNDSEDDIISESESETDSDDEVIDLPPDPEHEARMAVLRAENARLRAITEEQDAELAAMQIHLEGIREAITEMRVKRDQLRLQRERDLEELRGLGCFFWESMENLAELEELGLRIYDEDDMEAEASGGGADAGESEMSDGSLYQ